MNIVCQGLLQFQGLKFLVGAAILAAFVGLYSAPAQHARHQAEASAATRLASCLAKLPPAPDALGRWLDRQTCKLSG